MTEVESSAAVRQTQTDETYAAVQPVRDYWRHAFGNRRFVAGMAGLAVATALLAGCGGKTEATEKPTHSRTMPSTTEAPTETPAPQPSTTNTPPATTQETPGAWTVTKAKETLPVDTLAHTPLITFASAINKARTKQIIEQYPEVDDYINQTFFHTHALDHVNEKDIGNQQKLIKKYYPKVHRLDPRERVHPSTFNALQANNLAAEHLLGGAVISFTDAMLRDAMPIDVTGVADYGTIDMGFMSDELITENKTIAFNAQRYSFPTAERSAIVAVATSTQDWGPFGVPSAYKERMHLNKSISVTAVATVTDYPATKENAPFTEFRWTLIVPIGKLATNVAADSDVGVCIFDEVLKGSSLYTPEAPQQ